MIIAAQDDGPPEPPALSTVLVYILWQLGVRDAYGVCGREIARVWSALLASEGTKHEIVTRHTRHENGAGYAAYGSWAQTGRPVAVFVTTAPGITNAITSLETARTAGAKLVLLSPLTPSSDRGRLGIQDTSSRGFLTADLYTEGRLFDLAVNLETAEELGTLAGQLAMGLAGADGFMAHIAIPTTQQHAPVNGVPVVPQHRRPAPGVSSELADEIVALLARDPFAVWVGAGARDHAPAIRRLLDLTGAPAMSSPRGLGILDRHPQCIGVTGNGGRDCVPHALARYAPQRTLVLGTGLGEATSRWLPELEPPAGFIHVDLDKRVFARAYPHVPTLAVQADIGELLAAVLKRSAQLVHRPPPPHCAAPPRLTLVPADDDRPIHPAALMAMIQRIVVDDTDMPILADAASAMFWATRHLVFREPGRWLMENRFGAMGSAVGAVVGAAAGRGGSALAIVGDGAMHMQDEINTAVRYRIHAIWVVLNDSGLGIVRAGMKASGWGRHDADFPATDFAAVARARGADGLRVTRQQDLAAALLRAVDAAGPFVVDVVIDDQAIPPFGSRARVR